jgi:hypothetical protein
MEDIPPGSATINGLAYLENMQQISSVLIDFFIYDIIVRSFTFCNDNPFMLCSLIYKDFAGGETCNRGFTRSKPKYVFSLAHFALFQLIFI